MYQLILSEISTLNYCPISLDHYNVEAFKEITSKLIDETRKEEGCILYELFQDINDENLFMFVEDWKSVESHVAHDATSHIKELVPQMKELLTEPAEVLKLNLVK